MTTSWLSKVKTRAGLSILAYHGVALIIALILLSNSMDVVATAFPMIATSQTGAAAIWWTGAWLAPVLLDSHYQIRHWWLIGALGACQSSILLLFKPIALNEQPLPSLMHDPPSIKVAIFFGFYGGVSSLAYSLLLRLNLKKERQQIDPTSGA